jgi:hypothetical protein
LKDESSISKVIKKVKGAINKYKGHLFESEFYKYLKDFNDFDKVVWGGASGESDIIAHNLDNNHLFIFSLKNYNINRKNYWIKKEDLNPEIKYARSNHFDYEKIIVKLVVFNNKSEKMIIKDIDYANPKNIKIN